MFSDRKLGCGAGGVVSCPLTQDNGAGWIRFRGQSTAPAAWRCWRRCAGLHADEEMRRRATSGVVFEIGVSEWPARWRRGRCSRRPSPQRTRAAFSAESSTSITPKRQTPASAHRRSGPRSCHPSSLPVRMIAAPCRSMMLSTSFKSIRCAFPCVGVALRPCGRGAACGRRERPCPSCACSAPAPGRSPRGDMHAFPDRVRFFAREREYIGQESFDALVHRVSPPPISLADSPSPPTAPRRAREGRR